VLVLTRRPLNRLSILAWLVHPLAASSLLLLFLSSQSPDNPLFRLRFHLSQPALEDATRSALAHGPLATPAWVGLFRVRRVHVSQSEVRFVSDGCGVIDECGLMYLTGPIPKGRSKTRGQTPRRALVPSVLRLLAAGRARGRSTTRCGPPRSRAMLGP
jgi:hypothetical protein